MIKFAGIEFKGLKRRDVLAVGDQLKVVATLNAEFIVIANENAEFKKKLSMATCTFDGQIPYLIARLKNPGRDFEKISGSDFIYDACASAHKNDFGLFLLGGKEDSNTKSVEKIRQLYPGIRIEGYSPPFAPYPFEESIQAEINKRIEKARPMFIFVGFGAVKQENWIIDNYDFLHSLGVRLAIGSGGTFEFVSGSILRAPRLIQVLGLEGVFRFLVEPKMFRVKRLIKSLKIFKYVIG